MVTVPMEGEVVHELKPPIKANLAALGDVEPGTVEMRVSGVGAVPVKFDPATKLAVGTLLQPLKDRQVTVILSALLRGKKVEVRWNFTCDAVGLPSAQAGVPAVPGAPAVHSVSGVAAGSHSPGAPGGLGGPAAAAPVPAGANAGDAPR